MTKVVEKWLLFKYINGEFTPLSKPFKTKVAADRMSTHNTCPDSACGYPEFVI